MAATGAENNKIFYSLSLYNKHRTPWPEADCGVSVRERVCTAVVKEETEARCGVIEEKKSPTLGRRVWWKISRNTFYSRTVLQLCLVFFSARNVCTRIFVVYRDQKVVVTRIFRYWIYRSWPVKEVLSHYYYVDLRLHYYTSRHYCVHYFIRFYCFRLF